jgi:hypothetical protein
MSDKIKPNLAPHAGLAKKQAVVDDIMVNDSLGTVTIADSTGSDETKETGDAKKGNKDTRED